MSVPDFETLSLNEIIQLQNELSRVLRRRFGATRALVFTDVVGSTAFFQRFGDEAGRRLLQRNHDAVGAVVAQFDGHIVDTAGDGVFSCFPTAERAANALATLQQNIVSEREAHAGGHPLSVRAGLHFGPVLTDGVVVTGDAVNVAARVAGLAEGDEIRLSHDAFRELSSGLRLRCDEHAASVLKGVDGPIRTYSLRWLVQSRMPDRVRLEESEVEYLLPDLDVIRFGRLKQTSDGRPANEIVLELPKTQDTKRVSRWHIELRRTTGGFRLRSVSSQATEVDGRTIEKGNDVPVEVGSVARLGRVATLTFLATDTLDEEQPTLAPSAG